MSADVVATFSYYNLCRSIVLLHRKERVRTTQSSYFPPPTKTSNKCKKQFCVFVR
jgi:hypothetical protein